MKAPRVKRLQVATTQGEAASLHRESQFILRYAEHALGRPELALSLTMPPRAGGYRASLVPPVLAMNLPEGFLLDRVMARYRKAMDVNDDMNLLALTSSRTSGRVWARAADGEREGEPAPPMRLRDLLAAPGTESLFDELVERYGSASAISGVQPKIVLAEERAGARAAAKPGVPGLRGAIHTPDLIVKSAGAEYPGLAENEFLCMSMARAAGLETPEFWLSEDRSLFVIRRFDVDSRGYLGFEDMASLTGRHPREKYHAPYAEVARAIADFCAPTHRADSLERFFRQLVFCCLIRNGDAHLKNWGVLYGDPASADHDARLSPVYDLVCTVVWIARDTLALGLGGTKSWPDRRRLERFGHEHCLLRKPGAIIDEVTERALDFTPPARTKMWKAIREIAERARSGWR
ncbi:MAG: type II toxin-antitoxin system HipA family toxin [Betaproteobacteria bacterium]